MEEKAMMAAMIDKAEAFYRCCSKKGHRMDYMVSSEYCIELMARFALAAQPSGDGVALIAAERKRQVEAEGWTPEHDDSHRRGELSKAAACYAVEDTDAEVIEGDADAWPWSKGWDKRKVGDTVRKLTKAGALIAAEIDRINRRA